MIRWVAECSTFAVQIAPILRCFRHKSIFNLLNLHVIARAVAIRRFALRHFGFGTFYWLTKSSFFRTFGEIWLKIFNPNEGQISRCGQSPTKNRTFSGKFGRRNFHVVHLRSDWRAVFRRTVHYAKRRQNSCPSGLDAFHLYHIESGDMAYGSV